MLLYLIRHAEAADLGNGIARDFDRPLTERGREQCRSLGAAFTKRGIVVDTVVASPLVRAHQTATELLAAWHPGTRPVTCDDLIPQRLRPVKLSEFLATTPTSGSRVPSRAEKAVAAVGHMPDLGAYLEWLLAAAPETVHLAKAAAACLRFKNGVARAAGSLEWLVTPEWFGSV